MKTYPIHDEKGRLLAFEIPNGRIGRSDVCKIIQTIPGAVLRRKPKLLSWLRESVFCEFELDGARYEIEEPFGDNSRYWIGPVPSRWLPQTEKVHEAFARW